MARSNRTVEERLQELEDRDAIRQIVSAYSYSVDGCNAESVGSLYTEQGVYAVGDMAPFVGRAQVAAISADTDPGSQTLRVRATLEGNSGFLPGQQFSVILWLDAPEGSVTIPSSALVTSSSGQAVFRLDEGQIGRVAIDHDLGGDDRIRVVQASGLAPGMDVVTSGTSTLKSMIPAE